MFSVRYALRPNSQLLRLRQTGFTFGLNMFKVVKVPFAACSASPLILLLRDKQGSLYGV